MYDIFFIIKSSKLRQNIIRKRFPLAKFCIVDDENSIQDAFYSAQKRSLTEMFWIVDLDYDVIEDFDFKYDVPTWDEKYVHVFKEATTDSFKGIYLIPKSYHISEKEAEHIFFVNKKEIDVIASKYYKDIFFLTYNANIHDKIKEKFPLANICVIDENNTVKDALYYAQSQSSTSMFWFVEPDHIIDDKFDFNYVVPKWNKKYVHVFKEATTDSFSGIYLIPKSYHISEKEAEKTFFVNKKEIDEVASSLYRDIFYATYDKNLKDKIESRFPTAKILLIDDNNTVKDALYLAQSQSSTSMFWFVEPDHDILNSFDINFIVPKWNKQYVHMFKEEKTEMFKGLSLIPKSYHISEKEAEYVYFVNKKEIDEIASSLVSMDIFFISYDEPNADENWNKLKTRFSNAKRIERIKGIHQAHIEAAKRSSTGMFWVVDADAVLVDSFEFDVSHFAKSTVFSKSVYVFQSINPINDLVYGYGGVKLLPKIITMKIDTSAIDMTTSISSYFYPIPIISNISSFNTDPFNTWKSAFRECVKLSSKIIKNQKDKK